MLFLPAREATIIILLPWDFLRLGRNVFVTRMGPIAFTSKTFLYSSIGQNSISVIAAIPALLTTAHKHSEKRKKI